MPELPEVRAHAERLDAAFAGSTLASFSPLSFTALKTASPAPDQANGAPLGSVTQRGKYLVLGFAAAGDPISFVVHLMQGGRLRPDAKQSPRPRGGVARWTFDDARALLLTEAGTERRAGVWVVAGRPDALEPLAHLGPDADTIDAPALATLLHTNSMRLHNFLRDQRLLAGIGRRLANEVCFRAGLSPFAPTAKLDEAEAARLVAAISSCVEDGLAAERARDDMSSSKERPGVVHHRVGEACVVCGDVIRSVEYRTHTVAYCATCQTGGKVLADNTTSKFLR